MATRIIIVMLLALNLVACGQKGPLYLPDSDDKTEVRQ